jgi:hypothetical protein
MVQRSRSAKPAHDDHGTFGGFAHFLRKYMSAWPVLIAVLIGPITKYLHLVPTYKDHENLLAAVTALYGFLLAAALFYYRPALVRPPRARRAARGSPAARRMLIWGDTLVLLLPAALLALSIGSFFRYTSTVQASIRAERGSLAEFVEPSQLSAEQILARTDLTNIPNGNELLVWYLTMFLAAETSLVVMALAEYLRTGSPSSTGKS